jgi:AraC-like DNA-binding protein
MTRRGGTLRASTWYVGADDRSSTSGPVTLVHSFEPATGVPLGNLVRMSTTGVSYRHRVDLLPGAVASAVSYEATGLPSGSHRGLPSPWITFIVSVDGPVRVSGTVDDGDRFDPDRATSYDVMVAGLHPVAARVEQPPEQQGVQLAVHPLAAQELFGCRAAELLGPGDHGHEVLGTAARELHERVSSESAGDARLDVVQQWLRARVDGEHPSAVRPELWQAWLRAERSGGRCRVGDLADEVLLSPRQLHSLMVAELGLSPKQLLRLFRFHRVIGHLSAGSPGLADVAASSGYADQGHLSREFRQMAGCTPTTWLVEERRNIQDGGYRNRPD